MTGALGLLQNKTVLVTGAARSIGAASAALFAAEGVQHAVDATVEHFGRLDLAFDNAGTSVAHVPIVDLPEDDFDRVTATNYKGVFLALRAEVRALRATAGSGSIVNNSSVGSSRGQRTSPPTHRPSERSTASPKPQRSSTDQRGSVSTPSPRAPP